MNRLISRALRKYTSLNVQDYVALLHLSQGYGISELRVEPEDWLANKSLIDLALPREGVLVLGVQRKGGPYLGAPQGTTMVKPYDTLLLYADLSRIEELDNRRAGRAGDAEHAPSRRGSEQSRGEGGRRGTHGGLNGVSPKRELRTCGTAARDSVRSRPLAAPASPRPPRRSPPWSVSVPHITCVPC